LVFFRWRAGAFGGALSAPVFGLGGAARIRRNASSNGIGVCGFFFGVVMAKVINDFVMNLPHEYYPALGEFLFRSAQLENQMHNIAWVALNIEPKQGRVLTIGAGAKAVRGMLSTTASEEMRGYWIPLNSALKQGIDSIVRRSKEYTDLRNRLAHGRWEYTVGGKPEGVSLMYTKERDEKFFAKKDKSIDAAFLHRKCAEVKSLNLAAKRLLIDLYEFRGWNTGHLHSRKNVA
jgi:hypothetical protein